MERSFWPLVQHYWNTTANFAQRAKKNKKKNCFKEICRVSQPFINCTLSTVHSDTSEGFHRIGYDSHNLEIRNL